LHRDLDIVLIDGYSLSTGMLPFGRLREPHSSLKRADIIILTKGTTKKQFQYNVHFNNAINKPLFEAKQVFSSPYYLSNNAPLPSQIDTKKIIVLTGIASPDSFLTMLNEAQYEVVKHIKKKDHHNYTQNDIDNICNECNNNNCKYLATTEKDAVKLAEYLDVFSINEINVIVFPIALELCDEEAFKNFVVSYINKLNQSE